MSWDVSVVIPTFNRADSLDGVIRSALEQTALPREVIVVDDGSTDETTEVCRRWGEKIRYFRQQNAGVSAARNRGAREAEGTWLSFLDSDDRWHPSKLEVQLEALDDSPRAEWSITGGNVPGSSSRSGIDPFGYQGIFPILDDLNLSAPELLGRYLDSIEMRLESSTLTVFSGDAFPVFLHGNLGLPSSLLVRAETFERLDGFDEDLRLAEETEFFLRLSATALGAVVAAPLVERAEGDSAALTASSNTIRLIENALASLERSREFRDPFEEALERARERGLQHLTRRYAYSLLANLERRRSRQVVLGAWKSGRLPKGRMAWLVPATLLPRPLLRAAQAIKSSVRRFGSP